MCLSHLLKVTALLCLAQSSVVLAEVYFYAGPDGERMVSDRPVAGYQLIHRRDTLKNAGHILANRAIATGGPGKFQSYIHAASNRFGVDPALVEAVIQVESGFNPHAISSKGATGLMQLMQETASEYRVKDRHNPRQNINAGVAHLRKLMDKFNDDISLAVAAYNAGATAVEKYGGIPPYPETRQYVSKVMRFHSQYRQLRYGAE